MQFPPCVGPIYEKSYLAANLMCFEMQWVYPECIYKMARNLLKSKLNFNVSSAVVPRWFTEPP